MTTTENIENSSNIFDILRSRGILSPSMQKIVAGFAAKWGISNFKALTETHMANESQIAEILADKLGFPRLTRVKIMSVPKEILALIPFSLALDMAVFPFELTEAQRLHVVFADPSDPNTIRNLETLTGKTIEPFIGEHSEIIAAIQRHYPLELQLPSLLEDVSKLKSGSP